VHCSRVEYEPRELNGAKEKLTSTLTVCFELQQPPRLLS
jgi:hypothetical protein